eukprot:g58876.t1
MLTIQSTTISYASKIRPTSKLVIFDDPATRRLYGVQDENRETKTPLRKSVNFKTNEARIQLILATALLGKDAKIIQVADTLKAMYPSTSLDALIRDHFAASSGYRSLGSSVADKARSMATALVEGHVAWQAIVEVETGASFQPATSEADAFTATLLQPETDFKKEMDMLRKEDNELRASKSKGRARQGYGYAEESAGGAGRKPT